MSDEPQNAPPGSAGRGVLFFVASEYNDGMFADISRLFASPTRIKFLKFFVAQPDLRATAHEAAAVIGVSHKGGEKELRSLARAGVLSARSSAKGTVFSLHKSHELVPPLAAFLETVTKPSERVLADMFRTTRGVVGVVATGTLVNEPRSALDLLIIAKSKNRYDHGIAKAVKKVERLVATPLTYAILEVKEYEGRLEARDRLLRDVFEFTHSILIGKHRFDGKTAR